MVENKTIQDILETFPDAVRLQTGCTGEAIGYIWSDSRKIRPGDMYLVSSQDPKEAYLQDAFQRGAQTILLSEHSLLIETAKKLFANVILTPLPPETLQGKIAAYLLDYPTRKMKVVAVTGTNGKTSMTHILEHFASCMGYRSGIIGTLYARYGDTLVETGYTTPDSSTLQQIFAEMAKAQVEYVFLEASSHGLKLGRMHGTDLHAGVFTNLTKDHLDFHETMEDYLRSKFRLFQLLDESYHPDAFGVIYADAGGGTEMKSLVASESIRSKILYVGKGQDFEYQNVELAITGSKFLFCDNRLDAGNGTNKNLHISTNLLGGFNTTNLSLAIATWLQLGHQSEKIPTLTDSIPRIPGRFDIYPSPEKESVVVVDYAHTPDALQNILTSCREMNPKQLICLFGCGGDRDRTKRPEMAKIAEDFSDFVVVTSDNPRTEDPESILDEIEKGFSAGFQNYHRITDRRQAIQKGIERLQPGGILAVCGKGHENYQIIGKEKFYFDDGEEVESAFQILRNNRKNN